LRTSFDAVIGGELWTEDAMSHERTDRARSAIALAGAAGIGAAIMYAFDPALGARRRAIARDKLRRAMREGRHAADTSWRDLRNRAHGFAAEMPARLHHDGVADDILVERVRAAIGRAVSHPHALVVRAEGGAVTLGGPVLRGEVDGLLASVRGVRGVERVEDQLERHAHRDVAALRGGRTRAGRRHLGRERAPAVRLLEGIAGGAFAAIAAARGRAILAACGAALLGRAVTVSGAERLLGIRQARRSAAAAR
jgi:hypothetical protein